jgi:hypothetical protein
MASNTKSALFSTSKENKKNMSAYEKNPDYSPKPYGHFIRGAALDYFKKHFYSP